MHSDNIFAALDALEVACTSITAKFHVEKGQIEKLKAGVASLKANRDVYCPQIAVCGEKGAGKTTLLKYLVHDWTSEILELPSQLNTATRIPTIVHIAPEEHYGSGRGTQYELQYLTRDEYIDGVLWVIEAVLGEGDPKVAQAVVDARSSRSFEALKRAVDAAHDLCGADLADMRKSMRKVADDCRSPDRLDQRFREFAAGGYRKICTTISALEIAGADPLDSLVKCALVRVRVDRDKMPSPIRLVDLPALNAGAIHHLHFAYQLSQKGADAFIVCVPADKAAMDEFSARCVDNLIGSELRPSRLNTVFYALTKSISPADDKFDVTQAENALQMMIATRGWPQAGAGAGSGRARVFSIDALAGLLHDLRGLADLFAQAKATLGLENEQDFKAIKKKWNSGRVGDDNQSLRLIVRRHLTYDWPKDNFIAVKSAASELAVKLKGVVETLKPEQSKWHEHKFNSIRAGALAQFEERTGQIERQADLLHRALRRNIISTLSQTLAPKETSETQAARVTATPSAAPAEMNIVRVPNGAPLNGNGAPKRQSA